MTERDPDFPPEEIEAARVLFAQECRFIWAAATADQLPPLGLPEVAFAGRSNVGKSSLVNALTGRKTLARTSNTPGRTQELIFFDLGGRLQLVDLPGYGYAKVSKTKVQLWTDALFAYLRGRTTLQRVNLLVDARHEEFTQRCRQVGVHRLLYEPPEAFVNMLPPVPRAELLAAPLTLKQARRAGSFPDVPLIVLTQSENFTLQLALNSFQGELQTQWSSLLAMTVLTLLPIALVFMFLQKYIATGIASTGGK